jgi:threonylcarbamoyladenosine tRNA methylthiotransferase CDKAL1
VLLHTELLQYYKQTGTPFMPQTKNNTVQVLSFGCASNFGEGEMIAGLLQESGLHLTSTAQEAQAVVLNVCTVKGIRSALKEIRMAIEQAPNVPIVITGCTTPELAQQAHALSPSIHISNTHKLKSIPELVSRVLHNQSTSQDDFETTTDSKINLPRQRYNPVVGIVPVCSGCLDYCTFCSTRLVKGQLYSFAPSEIIADIKMHLQQGCQEIWITGQDAACYGADIGTNLPTLIHQILNEIPGNYKIRIGMGNPGT